MIHKLRWFLVLFALYCSVSAFGQERSAYSGNDGFGMGTVGQVSKNSIGIDPMVYLTSWNYNHLSAAERADYYRESSRPEGGMLREYWIEAVEGQDIEIAPGIFFPAWSYNGQVPGPTIRATEGDLVRIYFTNAGRRPHTMHFHGFHPESMDGAMPADYVYPGESFTYEFEAAPFGVHLYHCHSTPLTQHIHKGLYGVYIVDPKDSRPPAGELIMMMNGFDTNFDEDNEVYAVNSIANYYVHNPIRVKLNEPLRIYLVNILEFDETNSFHLHANFFYEYRTGTSLTPDTFTDTVIFGQAERSILEVEFQFPGKYMFHAHKTEFAELGWMGLFEVVE